MQDLSEGLDKSDDLSTELHKPDEINNMLQWLYFVAKSGDLEIVKFIVDKKHQNPLQKDKIENTALHAAAQGGCLDILKYLIDEKDYYPACLDRCERTPLHDALNMVTLM